MQYCNVFISAATESQKNENHSLFINPLKHADLVHPLSLSVVLDLFVLSSLLAFSTPLSFIHPSIHPSIGSICHQCNESSCTQPFNHADSSRFTAAAMPIFLPLFLEEHDDDELVISVDTVPSFTELDRASSRLENRPESSSIQLYMKLVRGLDTQKTRVYS